MEKFSSKVMNFLSPKAEGKKSTRKIASDSQQPDLAGNRRISLNTKLKKRIQQILFMKLQNLFWILPAPRQADLC